MKMDIFYNLVEYIYLDLFFCFSEYLLFSAIIGFINVETKQTGELKQTTRLVSAGVKLQSDQHRG